MVLTSSYTFTATACAIQWAGFEPVFVDIDAGHWHLDPEQLAGALDAYRGRVAGVLACTAFGTPPPAAVRSAWRELCGEAGVPLVIDSAPGFGAVDEDGVPMGGTGELEVFSFHATKPFAIGEGGAVFTRDTELAARVHQLVNFGLEPGTRTSVAVGLNGKMSELHAATGLAALERLDEVVAKRQALARYLTTVSAGHGVTLQAGAEASTWQYFQCLADTPAQRDAAIAAARELRVEVRTLHDPALHMHPAFEACARHGELPVTEAIAARSVSLPIANDLADHELARIAEVLRRSHEVPSHA